VLPLVAIVVVQYAGWRYTTACLESLSRINYPSYLTLVVDNGSPDNSAVKIEEWARERSINCVHHIPAEPSAAGYPLIILALPLNKGYAAANNAAFRLLLGNDSIKYFWLLNNDTEVDPSALRYLVERLEQDSTAGLAGSTLFRASERGTIQAMGGGYFIPWLGYSKLFGEGKLWENAWGTIPTIEKRLDFILGASCLVRKKYLEKTGFMDETLFLYFEELDWFLSSAGKFGLAYAPKSFVFHYEGASIQAGNQPGRRKSPLADYYFHRNRLVIVRRYFPLFMPTAYISLIATILRRAVRRQWRILPLILKAGWDALWLKKNVSNRLK